MSPHLAEVAKHLTSVSICFHYENTPIHIYRKFHLKKLNFFSDKKTLILSTFLLKT